MELVAQLAAVNRRVVELISGAEEFANLWVREAKTLCRAEEAERRHADLIDWSCKEVAWLWAE